LHAGYGSPAGKYFIDSTIHRTILDLLLANLIQVQSAQRVVCPLYHKTLHAIVFSNHIATKTKYRIIEHGAHRENPVLPFPVRKQKRACFSQSFSIKFVCISVLYTESNMFM
jgi:hypothetical protein